MLGPSIHHQKETPGLRFLFNGVFFFLVTRAACKEGDGPRLGTETQAQRK